MLKIRHSIIYNSIIPTTAHLILDTGGGVAEHTLVEDREDAAASALADGGANLREVAGIGRSLRSCEEHQT